VADIGPAESEFLWGVATSPYQSEGGYNGADEPQTNWAAAERRGDVATVGRAAEFWTRFHEDFALCRGLGLNAFRLGIEWSRIQPTLNRRRSDPRPFDYAALDHYAEMLAACRNASLEPIVTLHHFVHPAWLGADPWLRAETPELFATYVSEVVGYINAKLTDSYNVPPIRYYITINEPNMLVLNTYLGNQFPSRARSGLTNTTRAYNELLRAHVLAYNCIHDLHAGKNWPAPLVTLNNYCSDLYWSDKLWLDLLSLPKLGVARENVEAHILEKARQFDRAFRRSRISLHKDLPYYVGTLMKRISNWIGRRFFKASALAPLLDAIYASPRHQLMDYVGLDYYDPFAAHVFRLPVWWDHEFKNKSVRSWMMNSVTSKWWDWRVLPRGLQFFCEYYDDEYKLPLLIAENGMALRRRRGQPEMRRRDRMTRSQFLRLHVHEVDRIRKRGVPLIGYLHWSLFDNYEWGTYTPRFGLYSIDYDRGTDRLVEDQFGDRPSETYARLIAESRANDS
jgi:beta-glucosidase/6-phospho-beta-glucosidase/beta-galactosidase